MTLRSSRKVTWPCVVDERLLCARIEPKPAAASFCAQPLKQIVGEERNVFGVLPQWRDRQPKRVDAEVEVAAKLLLSCERREVPVSRRNQAYVHLPFVDITQSPKPFFFERLE
jgi:hypothetical protein